MIVAISGVDGSGKSSLASNLVDRLVSKGHKVKLVYLGNYFMVGHLVTVIHKVYRIFKPAVSNQPIANPFLTTTPKSCFQKLWLLFSLIDNALAYLTLKFYVLFGYTVICDRYFYDKLVGFIYHGYCGSGLEKIYLFFTPSADIQIILDQESATCLARETCGNHSLEFYDQLRKLYGKLQGLINCHYFDVKGKNEADVAGEVFLEISENISR